MHELRKKLNLTIIIVASTVLLFTLPGRTYAACQPIFGGGTTCFDSTGIGVDKLIQNPVTKTLEDNIGPDNMFTAKEQIVFKITVANSGKSKLTRISVKDTLPIVISYVSGGTHDPKDNSVSYTIDSLDAGRTTVTTITGTILDGTLNTTCYANTVTVLGGGKRASDNASFCVTGKNGGVIMQNSVPTPTPSSNQIQSGQTVQQNGNTIIYPQPQSKKTPATGPEAISLFALLPSAIAGVYISRKARRT